MRRSSRLARFEHLYLGYGLSFVLPREQQVELRHALLPERPIYAVPGRVRARASWSAEGTDFDYRLPEAERKWWY
ncbi:hypothetical protein [Cyanobium sp. ATX 6F1]|uniref:hypothetical protein n=1 Tax=unclassified Cyanobium TaxID=2627006 RepID=UPI0020CEEB3D|nr:hypothetical protein [Cyanobium sp. ATX 6F1]MCP9917741.1 hypothetical protein [Cyanobium sp. ATX 6F1]